MNTGLLDAAEEEEDGCPNELGGDAAEEGERRTEGERKKTKKKKKKEARVSHAPKKSLGTNAPRDRPDSSIIHVAVCGVTPY